MSSLPPETQRSLLFRMTLFRMTLFRMSRSGLFLALALGFWGVLPATARATEEPSAKAGDEKRTELHPSMAAWQPYLGAWEVDATWTSGAKLWSRAEYRPAVAGRFVEIKTWVRDGDGPVYLRYHSMVGPGDEEGDFRAHNFTFDGRHQTVDYQTADDGALTTEWEMGEATVRERLELKKVSEGARWQVWMGQPGGAKWAPLMDARWRRVGDLAE